MLTTGTSAVDNNLCLSVAVVELLGDGTVSEK